MLKTTDEAREERLARARSLVADHAYLETAGAVYVYSDQPGVPGYEVRFGSCPCPDAQLGYARRHLSSQCKHFWTWAIVTGRVA